MARWIDQLKQWAKQIKRDVYAVWFAARDPETPFLAKLAALLVAAYAISPIDLIPDFIPVLGYLDDLILMPLGIMLVLRLVPTEVMQRCRLQADAMSQKPSSYIAALVFIIVWLGVAYLAYIYLYRPTI
ncbi:YkvA family protein [Acinetobacter towneri]|uniref:YkvA family protein n=1 Tax=Acinetobacter towneri TaxID=202956 RepID=UPI002DB923A5|nr:YkvA family protein [Acinetobacter towneri]MEB6566031.1 YkvA family protein [Acinetobacter towneri]